MALRIDILATTPACTISAVTSTLWEDLANNASKDCPREMINMKKIQCAEKMIRGAFVELYRGLDLIKTYCTLNLAAFHEDSQEVQQAASARCIERRTCATPTVIVIGCGISGVAAARFLTNVSFKVIMLESRDRFGGRIHTDYSFGCPVDLGASWYMSCKCDYVI